MATRLTANFTLEEYLAASSQPAPPELVTGKLPAIAAVVQWIRDLAGSAGFISSWYRSPEHNAAVRGVNDSQHLTGEAVDASFPLISLRELSARVVSEINAGRAPEFGQLIFYTDDEHIHVSVQGATEHRRQLLVASAGQGGKRQYAVFTGPTQLPVIPRAASLALLAVSVGSALAFFFPAIHTFA